MDTWKLQKLVYYSQAWHLAWDGEPIFTERIEAWADGPVCRELYDRHRGSFTVDSWRWGDPGNLSDSEHRTVRIVVDAYSRLSGRQLSRLTHEEAPWSDARAGLSPGVRSNIEITRDAMKRYYSSLDADEDTDPVDELPSLD